jgi:micrococcal nuclease
VLAAVLLLAAAGLAAAQTVYVTKTGTKYHRAGCSALGKSSTAIPLSEAAARGFEPCGLCDPPVLEPGAGARGAAAPSGTEARAGSGAVSFYKVNAERLSRTADADTARMLRARVIYVVDGDTIKVSLQARPKGLAERETIRLIGVDTPETVDPRRPVQAFGREASAYTKHRLLNRDVLLAFDWDLRDKYDRLLAYVWLPREGCFNAELVREGYGHAYLSFAFQFSDEFRGLEREAKTGRRGLWGG